MNRLIAVSFGGGTNSTALLVGMQERGIRPDFITFADTGGERPHTYRHIEDMQKWLKKVGFPPIVTVLTVDKSGDRLTLEQDCINKKMLPSVAYGFKTCSQKHKIAPQDKYYNNNPVARSEWNAGRKIIKMIGFDADEERRAKYFQDKKYTTEYPLIEWGWTRDDCVSAINRAGLPLPGKSSCFFCPASKNTEIRQLAALHPDLMERAIKIESNADLTSIKGLGRNFSWENVIATDDMFKESYIEMSCGCYD